MNTVVLLSLKKRTCLFVAMCVALFATAFNSSNAAYSNIGTKSGSSFLNRFYVGADIMPIGYNFSLKGSKNLIDKGSLFRRFENFNVHVGWRPIKFIAVEGGYIRLGNIKSGSGSSVKFNGVYANAMLIAPIIDIKIITIESYISGGYIGLKSNMSGSKFDSKWMVGAGLQTTIYGSLAVRAGIDYIHKKTIFGKIGIAYYFSI